MAGSRSTAAWIAFVTRIAVVRLTWLAWVAGLAGITWIAAVFRSILFSDSVWEQGREAGADWIVLSRNFCKTSGKSAQLNWYDDFLLSAYTQRNDQISVYFSVRAYAQISSAAIGCQTGFCSNIGELCKSGKKCGVHGAGHTDFKEIRQHQRMSGCSHIYFCTYGEYAFVVAPVA